MAYSAVPTVANGDSWSAAQHNTYIKDNLAAIWVGTTAGDMDYYSSATAKTRLAAGSGGSILKHNGTTPGWLAMGAEGYFLSVVSGALTWVAFYRYQQALLNTDTALQVGDDAFRFRIPSALNGWNIATVAMSRKSGTGVPAIQIRNVSTAVDVLSTKLTIDSGETDSSTAAAPAVINTANDGVLTGQQFAIDVDVAGTSTLYCFVEIGFLKP